MSQLTEEEKQQLEGFSILDNPIHGILIPSTLVVVGCSVLIYLSGEKRLFYAIAVLFVFLGFRAFLAYGRRKSIWPNKWSKLELEEQTLISKNSAIYRFKMKTSFETLDFAPGQNLAVRTTIDGEEVIRYYTPISSNIETGHFDLIVKSYPDGKLSKHFAGMKPDQQLEFQGPVGKLNYAVNSSKEIAFIAGGSGITAVLQLLNAVIIVPEDVTKIKVLYANDTENDILLRDELDDIAEKYPNFEINYVLRYPTEDWDGETGLVTKELMQKYLPKASSDNRLFICGPKAMNESVLSIAEELGWPKGSLDSKGDDQVFVY
ncbi:hypothetical protein TPHA_0I00150 [Tetrapisispora phaffii CBS 4417]|uniref:NADH-cytochrome b5 reductase n=1 Tax=Tetrapisispora phaffii (strain ATCC 24235 / CBS 4417 / NBRC 1672 / NRRL Y-8282 / UCD 70-5) TaxID=1071381 RepID=G8BX94_TETPH|nr:hypothetical protein TPHA_0I00150 [Tetrapisispora phaffii CBS 4417]CCE64522.1 hypothetical protein TPHA_0I00150 [Tetrapisispora phaffii CBS 4417]